MSFYFYSQEIYILILFRMKNTENEWINEFPGLRGNKGPLIMEKRFHFNLHFTKGYLCSKLKPKPDLNTILLWQVLLG